MTKTVTILMMILALVATACGSDELTGPVVEPTPTPDPVFVAAPGYEVLDSAVGPPSEVGELGFILLDTDLTLYLLETTEEAEVGPIAEGGTYELGGWSAEVTFLRVGERMKVIVTNPSGVVVERDFEA